MTRENLKEALGEVQEQCAWVDYSRGMKEGYLRFKEPDSNKTIMEKLEGKLKVCHSVKSHSSLKSIVLWCAQILLIFGVLKCGSMSALSASSSPSLCYLDFITYFLCSLVIT